MSLTGLASLGLLCLIFKEQESEIKYQTIYYGQAVTRRPTLFHVTGIESLRIKEIFYFLRKITYFRKQDPSKYWFMDSKDTSGHKTT